MITNVQIDPQIGGPNLSSLLEFRGWTRYRVIGSWGWFGSFEIGCGVSLSVKESTFPKRAVSE